MWRTNIYTYVAIVLQVFGHKKQNYFLLTCDKFHLILRCLSLFLLLLRMHIRSESIILNVFVYFNMCNNIYIFRIRFGFSLGLLVVGAIINETFFSLSRSLSVRYFLGRVYDYRQHQQ